MAVEQKRIDQLTADTDVIDDDDMLPLVKKGTAVAVKKLFSNIKSTLKTYFDSLYSSIGHNHSGTYVESETDPVFTAWDKSTGISITESQISDFGTYEESANKVTAFQETPDDTHYPSEKLVNDQLALKEDSLPTTPVSNPETKYLNGNRAWSEIIIGSGGFAGNVYLSADASSDVVGYNQVKYELDASETIREVVVNNNTVLSETSLYEAGIGVTTIPSGVWRAVYFTKVSSANSSTTLSLQIFVRHADTSETNLFTMTSDDINFTDYGRVVIESSQPAFTVVETDRLGVRTSVTTTRTSNTTVNYKIGDGSGAYFNTTLQTRHSQLRDKNGEVAYQHLTEADRTLLDNTSGSNTGDQVASDFDIKDLTDSTSLMDDWNAKMENPMTTALDLIVGGTAGAPARLAKGTADQVLAMNSDASAIAWADPAAGGGQSLYECIVAESGGDYTTVGAAVSDGKTRIFVKNGTYTETGSITVPVTAAPFILHGESRDGVFIDFGNNAYKITTSSSGGNVHGVDIRNLTFKNGTDNLLELLQYHLTAVIKNVKFDRSSYDATGKFAMYTNGTDATVEEGRVYIKDVEIYLGGKYSSGIYLYNNKDVLIDGLNCLSTYTSSDKWIASTSGSRKSVVVTNSVFWGLYDGITTNGDITISNCYFQQQSRSSVYVTGSNNIIKGCTFGDRNYSSSTSYEIFMDGATDSIIEGNYFYRNGSHCIWMKWNDDRNLIVGNYFYSTSSAIVVGDWGDSDFNTIKGNYFFGASTSSSVVTVRAESLKNDISGNYFYNCSPTAPVNHNNSLTTITNNVGVINPIAEKYMSYMKNTSGGNLVAGDVVIIKSVAGANEVTTTTTAGDNKVFGVLAENIDNNAWGYVQTLGKTVLLKVDGTDDIAIGDLLSCFTTAGIAQKAVAGETAFAMALEAYSTDDSSGVIDALLITPRLI